ncbi:MAG: UDP-glucose 4-epimerase, partial [Thermoleophilales bacterium]|nr:UDP-glucose 4-epimerase [Thermoleophilales bacterium]
IPNFISAALEGRQPVVYGDGNQSRDFTYVDNVVDANLLALEGDACAGEVFNVACGERITLNAVLDQIRELTGSDLEPDHRPGRAGEVRHSEADITRATETLGYRPAVSFGEGLRRTLEHMADQSSSASIH